MSKHTPGILRTCGNSKCSCNLLLAENGDTIGTWYGDDDKSIEGVTVQCPDVETGRANGHRLRDCWNACTGLADPAAEIKAMREAIKAADAMRLAIIGGSGGLKRIQAANAYDKARQALAAVKAPTSDGTATVDDGFGTSADKCGPDCTLQVVRPGDIRCDGSGAKCPNKEATNGKA